MNVSVGKRILILLCVIFTLVSVYFITSENDYIYDTLIYRFVFDGNGEPDLSDLRYVSDFDEVWDSEASAYHNVNGRFPTHLMLHAFAGLWGFRVFGVVNAFVFVLFVYLVMRYLFGRQVFKHPWAWLVLTVCLMYGFPSVMETTMGPWYGIVTGCAYLWPAVLFMGVLICQRHYESRPDAGLGVYAGLFFLGFFGGWSNEAFSLPLSGALFLYYLLCRRGWPSKPDIVLIGSFFIGTIMLVIGSMGRVGAEAGKGIGSMLLSLIECYASIVFFWTLPVAVVFLKVFFRFRIRRFVAENPILCIMLVLCVMMSVVAHTGAQSLTGLELVSLLLIVRMLESIGWKEVRKPGWCYAVCYLIVLSVLSAHISAIAGLNARNVEVYRGEMHQLGNSPDGAVRYETVTGDRFVQPFANRMVMRMTPEQYCAAEFAYMSGAPGKLPMELNEREYEALIERPEEFFVPDNRIPGSGDVYQVGNYFVRRLKEGEEAPELTAYFERPDFAADSEWYAKLAYAVTGKKKSPVKLQTFEFDSRHGRYLLSLKMNARPSRID